MAGNMNPYKYLFKNIGLFTLSEFTSKFITFFMLPLYTYYLSTEEYAFIDLIQVTQNLVIPIITLSIADAVLRYCFDQNEDKSEVFTIGLTITIVASCLTIIGCYIARGNADIAPYWMLIAGSIITQMGNNLFSNFARAVDKVNAIAVTSILATALVAGGNIFMVAFLKQGISGYLIALVAGNVFRCICLAGACKIWKAIAFGKMRKKTAWRMLKYCLPMIPNNLFWWINSSIDKYFLTAMTTLSAVGLYSAATKIPTIGNTAVSVFNSAWRLSAFKEDASKNKNEFFHSVYDLFCFVMIIVTLGIIVFVRLLALILFSKEFYQAWMIVPPLMVGFYFNSINTFIGSMFLGAKMTKTLFTTTAYGAASNVILNFLFIPRMGIIGAAVATMMSNAIVSAVRFIQAKRWMGFSVSWPKQILTAGTALFLAAVACTDTIWLYIAFIPTLAFMLYLYRAQINFLLKAVNKFVCSLKKGKNK